MSEHKAISHSLHNARIAADDLFDQVVHHAQNVERFAARGNLPTMGRTERALYNHSIRQLKELRGTLKELME